MNSAHLICHNARGIAPIEKGSTIYYSKAWDISPSDAEKLINGKIYFHETKSTPSYFGGIIISYELIEIDKAHSKRIQFKINADISCKGVEKLSQVGGLKKR